MTWAREDIPYPRSQETLGRGELCNPRQEAWVWRGTHGTLRGLEKAMLTIHLSAGWPVASLHALLAFSRTPSRSALVMALLSGRSEAGLLLVKAERTQPSPLLTSDQGLISCYFVPLVEIYLQRKQGTLLGQA